MATVTVYERKTKKGKSFPIYYLDPFTAKKTYFKVCYSRREANSEAAKLRSMIDSQEYEALKEKTKNRKHRPMTFMAIGALCLKEWKRREVGGEISTNTLKFYDAVLRQINKDLGRLHVWGISREDILDYRTQVAQNSSVVNSNRRLFIIKEVFKRGMKEGALYTNPVSKMSYLNEEKHCRTQYLAPKKLNKLIELCKDVRAKHCLPAIILLAAEHGASKQEILDLVWKSVDFEENKIEFNRTKNKVRRTMHLMPRTREALLYWREHLEKSREKRKIEDYEDEYVFCHVMSGKPISEFKSAWKSVCKLAGLKDFHFHDLRHTYATNILSSGGDMKDVKDMLGHKDVRSTNRYTHLSVLRKENVQKRLAAHYEAV